MENFEQRYNKLHTESHFIFSKYKIVRKQYIFLITINNKKPESFLSAMIFFFPLEIPFYRKFYFQTTTSKRLSIRVNLNTWNMMNKFVKNFT